MPLDFDVCIIGGGISGAAVARDAAGRGLRVYLAEAGDFAEHTSSASSKLVHGGLRYLETYEFRMVREGLLERATLKYLAPHLVSPLKFLVPIGPESPRPWWLVRLGLYLYDFLGGRARFADSGQLSRADVAALTGLKPGLFSRVLHYTDGWGDDARLTLEMLRDAQARGADVGNYRRVEAIVPIQNGYRVTVAGQGDITARLLVNAAGPWANAVLDLVDGGAGPRTKLRWVKGSHIVVPMPPGPEITHALTLQSKDGRVIFVLPWLHKYLIVGTTDVEIPAGSEISCSDAERDYLLAAYNDYCAPVCTVADIVYTWAGVRPLVDDGAVNASKVSRDFSFAIHRNGSGGILTIYGGKLTVHRVLAEQALARVSREFNWTMPAAWTARTPLPRSDLDHAAFVAAHPELSTCVVPGISQADIVYAARHEFARTADDYLLRRTKLGVGMPRHLQLRVATAIDAAVKARTI